MARKVFDFDEEVNQPSYREIFSEKLSGSYSSEMDNYSVSDRVTSVAKTSDESEKYPDLKLNHEIVNKIDAVVTIDEEYQNAMRAAKRAELSAQMAKSAADDAAGKSAGFGKKKKAIMALQQSGKEQAEGLTAVSIAQKKTLELQEKLVEATKVLFMLGTSSLAANRSVYRQLELKMKNASEEEISDFARKELDDVLKQLNDQKDLFEREKELKNLVREQGEKSSSQINELKAEIENLKATISKMDAEKNHKPKEKPAVQKDEKNDARFEEYSENGAQFGEDDKNHNETETNPPKKGFFKKLFH